MEKYIVTFTCCHLHNYAYRPRIYRCPEKIYFVQGQKWSSLLPCLAAEPFKPIPRKKIKQECLTRVIFVVACNESRSEPGAIFNFLNAPKYGLTEIWGLQFVRGTDHLRIFVDIQNS